MNLIQMNNMNSIEFESNWIQCIWIRFKNLNSISFKLHAMSFNIFFQMELTSHKINSFFPLVGQKIAMHHNVKPKFDSKMTFV